MQKQLDEILQKRMDRKDFLKHVGMGIAIITGAAGVLKLFAPNKTEQGQQTVNLTYGASVYGGRPQ